MHHKTRTTLRDGLLLGFLTSTVIGLTALVSSGHPLPRLSSPPADHAVAHGALPPVTYTISQSETRHARLLGAAFDRIGFDLDSVAAGYISVPRVLVSALPHDIDRVDSLDARKDLFLRTLLPVILYVNDRIGEDRAELLEARRKVRESQPLSPQEVGLISVLADAYDQLARKTDAARERATARRLRSASVR